MLNHEYYEGTAGSGAYSKNRIAINIHLIILLHSVVRGSMKTRPNNRKSTPKVIEVYKKPTPDSPERPRLPQQNSQQVRKHIVSEFRKYIEDDSTDRQQLLQTAQNIKRETFKGTGGFFQQGSNKINEHHNNQQKAIKILQVKKASLRNAFEEQTEPLTERFTEARRTISFQNFKPKRPLSRGQPRQFVVPKTQRDRVINFLVRQADVPKKSQSKVSWRAESARKIEAPNVADTIRASLLQRRTSFENTLPQEVKEDNHIHIASKYSSMVNVQPTNMLIDHEITNKAIKFEQPFRQDEHRRKSILRKGSNITGLILQHLYRNKRKDEIMSDLQNINFDKQKLVKQFNQTLPEELEAKWGKEIASTLNILKGKLPGNSKKNTQKEAKFFQQDEKGFDMDQIFYLSNNKEHINFEWL